VNDCHRVRTKENRYKRLFYVLFILVLAYSAVIAHQSFSADLLKVFLPFFVKYYGPYQAFLFAFETTMFFWIFYLMNKKHYYEFQRNKNSMRFQYTLAFLYHIGALVQILTYHLSTPGDDGYPLRECVFLTFANGVPILFFLKFLALIKIKSHIDILQGVSKLDYLMKISVFQINKNVFIQKRKEEIGDSFCRFSSFMSDTVTNVEEFDFSAQYHGRGSI
jgi:hypothetical protein